MEYMHLREIRANQHEIEKAFERLMAIRMLVARPGACQWQFFRGCARVLLGPGMDEQDKSRWTELTPARAAQYKFEVENKLRRFYQRPGEKHPFVFTLVHRDRLHWYGLDREDYPSLCGYCLLVRDTAEMTTGLAPVVGPELAAYLEKVVTEALVAEFRAYAGLPELDFSLLEPWFIRDSPAWFQVTNVMTGCRNRGWRLDNPMNPSTCRMLSVVVKKVSKNDAEVATREYWYLRWWDSRSKKYTYPYRETNSQLYILNRTGPETWKIFQNLRPMPRSSQPFRWK